MGAGGERAAAGGPAKPWDQDELLRLMDVQPAGPGRYTAPAHGATSRNVVEAGQLLADAVVAASKEIPGQRVTSASMVFSRAARHDEEIAVELDVPHRGRTYSTVQARVMQEDRLRCAGLILMGTDADDLIGSTAPMPDVPPPDAVRPFEWPDMQVRGRELRIVDDAYDWDPGHVGPAELFVWTRFADAPPVGYLHSALMTHSVTHWTIAAALRPHAGYSEAMAHKTISTGISKATVAYHDDIDVTRWLLYVNQVVYTGRGTTQSEGRVYGEDGRLAASYSVHGMIRPLVRRPSAPDMVL
ncbi:Acyl-CoA thioesterase [Thermomonospora echinospora]|uniref:Acyl-CoA thioesterase n=1 Tax=Thermomonospora echinospora TaxID=1992 RepID=A0A1H6E6V7_9ACTN|nr:acyl-CoA thioesterase domain-containing protein [Thermomonospora echinospora]SEG92983.1 Acyl-CoA thioesterase [Thermomonospora echinospora]